MPQHGQKATTSLIWCLKASSWQPWKEEEMTIAWSTHQLLLPFWHCRARRTAAGQSNPAKLGEIASSHLPGSCTASGNHWFLLTQQWSCPPSLSACQSPGWFHCKITSARMAATNANWGGREHGCSMGLRAVKLHSSCCVLWPGACSAPAALVRGRGGTFLVPFSPPLLSPQCMCLWSKPPHNLSLLWVKPGPSTAASQPEVTATRAGNTAHMHAGKQYSPTEGFSCNK